MAFEPQVFVSTSVDGSFARGRRRRTTTRTPCGKQKRALTGEKVEPKERMVPSRWHSKGRRPTDETLYKVTTPRKEVREGRSFNPDEFAIALEQVAAGTAPEDYRKPEQFFARTCFTRALREHAGTWCCAAFRPHRQHRSGPDADHAVRWWQDTHAHDALPPREERRCCRELERRCGARARRRRHDRASGEGRGVRRQRVGPAAGARDALDRHRAPARWGQGVEALAPRRRPSPPGTTRSRGCSAAADARCCCSSTRCRELPQPPPRGRGLVPCVHPEPESWRPRARLTVRA